MQSCHSCTRHSVLTCSTILPSIVKIFLTVAELCSGNELLTPARPTADIHHFNNQIFPSENLVKNLNNALEDFTGQPAVLTNSAKIGGKEYIKYLKPERFAFA